MATEESRLRHPRRVLTEASALINPTTEVGRERRRLIALCAPFFILAVVAGIYPLSEMVRISVSEAQFVTRGFSLEAYRSLVSDPFLRGAAIVTLFFGFAATLASLGIAVPIAHALEKYDLPGERALVTLFAFPISLPGIVAAFMIIVLLGNTGLVTKVAAVATGRSPIDLAIATTSAGLFLAYLYSMIPRSLLLLRGTYAEVNVSAEEAARVLGASPFRTYYHVTLPQIKPGLIGSFVLTFRTALAIFGTVLIIRALSPNVWTYEINRALANGFRIQLAAAMATVWFVFVLLFTVGALRYTSAEVGL